MRFVAELPTPFVYTVGTPVTTFPMSCSFVFKNSMIFGADAFDKVALDGLAHLDNIAFVIFKFGSLNGLAMKFHVD